jgi:hypothetical protein
MVQGAGCRVQDDRLKIQGLLLKVLDLEFSMRGIGCRV